VLDPRLPEASYTLGVVLWQTGRATEATAPFRAAIAARPDYAEAHYMLGLVRKQEGDLEGALAGFREAVRLRPRYAEAQAALGQLLAARGDTAGAAAAQDASARLTREKADAQAAAFALAAGQASAEKGDHPAALASLREAVRLDPASARAHYQLALVLRQAGAAREAARHFTEAHRLAPYLPAGPS